MQEYEAAVHFCKLWLRAEGTGNADSYSKDCKDFLCYLDAEDAHDAAMFAECN